MDTRSKQKKALDQVSTESSDEEQTEMLPQGNFEAAGGSAEGLPVQSFTPEGERAPSPVRGRRSMDSQVSQSGGVPPMDMWAEMHNFFSKQMALMTTLVQQQQAFAPPSQGLRSGRVCLGGADPADFPFYQAGEDISEFFLIFEQACVDQSLDKKYWMKILRTQGKGELRSLMCKLPRELADDYENFVKLATAQFALSTRACYQKFETLTKKSKETFSALSARTAQAMDLWIAAAKANTFEQLRTVYTLEKFYKMLPRELAAAVRGKKPKSLQEAGHYADELDSFQDKEELPKAYVKKLGNYKGNQPAGGGSEWKKKTWPSVVKSEDKGESSVPAAVPVRPSVYQPSKAVLENLCFLCKQPGHRKDQCSQLIKKQNVRVSKGTKIAVVQRARDYEEPGGQSSPEISRWSSSDSNSDQDWEFSAPSTENSPITQRKGSKQTPAEIKFNHPSGSIPLTQDGPSD
ncbi:uncharacterized protein LOC133381121 [Rhineura floridana]|uniref:uncharacterized protein LOC133381121 n=1 Tax=Rhineura floridana TaxID=261503 RepID=UPI002AC7EE88|nr:uncharacterized protein LOC133381121 [Rhineura floridana]